MATNYTTKTAALKATKADMRQVAVSKKIEIGSGDTKTLIEDGSVSADKLLIGVDVKNEETGETTRERQSVLDLITNAGLNVGADADGDYTPESPVRTNKINFLGAYVNVVDNGDEGVNIYIGENKNEPSYSSLNDISAENYYVYASSTSAWSLPSVATAGKQYSKCSALSATEDIKIQDGAAVGNILKDATIKVTVTSDLSTSPIVFETGKISEVAGTTSAATSKTWDSEYATKGIKVVGTSLIKYTPDDAKNGFTPNSSSGKFTVTIDNDKVVGSKGGWYKVSVQLGATSKETSTVYVYGTQVNTPSTGKPVITYAAGGTKNISGLVYDSSGSFTLTVDNIANTQQAMTTSLNRVKVTKTAGDVDFGATVTTTTTGMSVTGTSTDETAVYKYVKTLSATATTAKKVSAAAKAQAYGQSALAGSEQASDACTATTFLYTDNSDDTDLVTKFQKDGARKYGDLAAAKSASGATATYDSSKSLITDYKDQLLVQDSKLRYPNSDKTSRYSGATETRYYVRPVKFGGSGQINNISVTVSGMTAFNNGTTRLYLVKKGVSDAQVLNWFKTAACSYGAPIADASAPSSNKWTCTINNDVFQLVGGVADTYYLVVEMTKDAGEIGQITLA